MVKYDLPKVPQVISYLAPWTDKYGLRRQGFRKRVAEVRQRQHIPEPHEYLYVISHDGALQISSKVLSLDDDPQELILHLVNVFREIFRSYAITAAGTERTSSLPFRKRHWKIVLEKQYSYEEARAVLDELLGLLPDDHRQKIAHCIEQISEHNPDFLAVGEGGFGDYFVFGFRSLGKYVFESPNLGNATYVFQDEWSQLDQLTKTQIREGEHPHTRIIHDGSWDKHLRQAIKS